MSINNRLINTGAAGGGGVAFINTDVDFRSFDVSDPSNISQLSSVSVSTGLSNKTQGGIALDRDNNVAYTVNSGTTLTAIDISDPSNLSVLGTLVLGTTLADVVIDTSTSVVYVCDKVYGAGTVGIYSVDISNPSSMSILQAYDGGSEYTWNVVQMDIDTVNKRLVVCNQYNYHFVTLNISNPSSISNLAFKNHGLAPASARWSDDKTLIYAVNETTTFMLNPSNLNALISSNQQPYLYYPDAPIALSYNMYNFYAAGRQPDTYLSSYSLANVGRTGFITGFTDAMGLDIDHENNVLFASLLGGKIVAVQLNNATSMNIIATFDIPNAPQCKRIALY